VLYNYIFICLEGSWSIVISGHSNSRKLRERERDYCVSQMWLRVRSVLTLERYELKLLQTYRRLLPDMEATGMPADRAGQHAVGTLYCLFCRILRWNWACPLWNACGCHAVATLGWTASIHTGYTCVKDAIGQEARCDTYYILYITRPRDPRRKSERLTFSGNDQAGSLF